MDWDARLERRDVLDSDHLKMSLVPVFNHANDRGTRTMPGPKRAFRVHFIRGHDEDV